MAASKTTTRKVKNAWEPLQKGDLIDIVAPAFRTSDHSVQNAIEFFKLKGFNLRVPTDLFGDDVLCAQTDEIRFKQLKTALLATDSKAVWCLRGGYGGLRLIPELLKLKPPKRSKLFVGLSDISSLHLFFNQNWKWPTIHGPMADRLSKRTIPREFVQETFDLVTGKSPDISFDNLTPINHAATKNKVIAGEVTGGNMMTLSSHLGTKLKWNTKGKILFLEETGEHDYRIDRIFEQLKQAGMIDSAAAIVFGDFTDCGLKDKTDKIWPVIQRFADSVKIPVLRGVQSGHDPIQRSVPFATPSTLYTGDRGRLVCFSGAKV